MTTAATNHARYWATVDAEVSALRDTPAEQEELAVRSTDFSTLYGVTLKSIGGVRVFAYYSVPVGNGPFPAVLMTPGYGSVVSVPPHDRRRRYVVLAVCARGQRLSDVAYAAAYPGLLTDHVQDPMAYPYRGIVADCLRSADFLLASRDVDPARIAVAGVGDLPLIVGALRPQVHAIMAETPFLFRDTVAALPGIIDYPLEELNDLLRENPQARDQVAATLALFDPARHASRVNAATRLAGSEGERHTLNTIAEAMRGGADVYVKTGRGAIDHDAGEAWLDSALR